MKIDAIRLRNVRRFGSEGIALEGFGPGLNVLSQPNEWGKSTVLEALRIAVLRKATGKPEREALLPLAPGDNPLIEVDLTINEGAWRVRKILAGAKASSTTEIFDRLSASLVAQGGDAERMLLAPIEAEEKKGRSLQQEGHAGLLWLRQGAVLQSGLSSEQRASLQSLLAAEVGEVTGEAETQQVLDAAAAELEKLETRAKGQPTGALKEALADVERLRGDLADAEERVERTGTLRWDLAAAASRLEALTDPERRQQLQRQRAEAQERFDKAQKNADSLSHTEDTYLAIERELLRLQRDRQDFETKLKRLNELDELDGKAAEQEADQRLAQGRAEVVLKDRTGLAERARATLQTLRDQIKRVREQERWQKEQDRLTEQRGHLSEAVAILSEVEGLSADADRDPIDVDRIQRWEKERDAIDAALRATAPDIEVIRGEDVLVDGAPLAPGERRALAGEGTITIGATELRIHAAGQSSDRQKRDEIGRAIERFATETGYQNYASALKAETARRQARQTRAELLKRLSIHAPRGIDALKAEIAEKEAATPPEAGEDLPSSDDAERLLLEAEKQAYEVDHALREAENNLRSREEEGRVLRLQRDNRAQERGRLFGEIGAPETHAPTLDSFDQERIAKERQLAALTLKKKEQEKQAAQAEHWRREIDALAARAQGDDERRQQAEITIARYEEELRQLYADDVERVAAGLSEEREAAEQHLARLEQRRAALRLLVDALHQEQLERRENFVRPLQRVLGPMLAHVFGDSKARFGSELSVEGLERAGQPADLEKLSYGAQEQVAVLVRLALARLLAERGKPVPLILDDALTYADDERLRRVFNVIRQTAEHTQVIVMTCHDRMFAALGGQLLLPGPFSDKG